MSLLDEDFDLKLDEWKVKIKYYLDEYFSEVSKLVKLENIFIDLSGEDSWLYWKFSDNDNIQICLSYMDDLDKRICNDGTVWRHVIGGDSIISTHYVTDDMILKCWEESV